ncbi:hypothetical protein TNIN_305811 [Trichonephila inaurata madagascariensis]|uniref:Uncharacterized protein n=1 Tax=Trichonephila inaurata madagascariensis TaxID=2747483 RepID=A0A8X7BYS3_9ARAC|nr:hypothetical protein TNIN_497231 [Trichonephila inaurata madagascariensis]GFY77720.1 hypothetical protein TNIN_305811 [Trichonephila inaurata madagascariensis]
MTGALPAANKASILASRRIEILGLPLEQSPSSLNEGEKTVQSFSNMHKRIGFQIEAADSSAPALNEKKWEEDANVVHVDKRRKIDFLHIIIYSFTQEPITHRQPIAEYHFSSQEINCFNKGKNTIPYQQKIHPNSETIITL